MNVTINDFNKMDKEQAAKELFSCCGSEHWVSLMMKSFPFISAKQMLNSAAVAWYNKCEEKDWLQSFTHHPRIGDLKSLKEKFASKEQAEVAAADEETIHALAKANADYENKFSFIFIVCATGKSAEEMLRLLQDRLKNSYEEELRIAMGEQQKITVIRFKKLFDHDFETIAMSQLTTHVLDTSIGRPGKDITVRLMSKESGEWKTITQGVTNADGRIADLLPPEKKLAAGDYKLLFETGNYFKTNDIKGFYPEVEIQFTVTDESHYHVPLLINPYGYSTYRGS